MPNRHFYLLSHYICYSLFFLFSVFWLQVNEFNSMWEDKGERAEDYCLLGKCIIQKIRYSCYEMCIMQRMTRIDKNDVLRQYNDKCIMCSDKLQYHLIISET